MLLTFVVDGALHICNGGVLNIVDQNLEHATFDGTASNCAIKIRNCTADSMRFLNAVTNMVLVVEDVAASVQTSAGGDFLLFSNTVSGGSISVEGLVRTIRGTAAAGRYTVVRFLRAVTDVSGINIKRLSITANVVAASGDIELYPVFFDGAVDGDGKAVFNFSSNVITAGSRWMSATGHSEVRLLQLHGRNFSNFEVFEISGNSIADITVSSDTSYAGLMICYTPNALFLSGTVASHVIFRSNRCSGVTVTGAATYARVVLWQAPNVVSNMVAGVSTMTMTEADISNIRVTCTRNGYIVVVAVLFPVGSILSMVHAGKVLMQNVVVGGLVASKGVGVGGAVDTGVRLLVVHGTTSGVKELALINCVFRSLNFTSETAAAKVYFLSVKYVLSVQEVRVDENRIDGFSIISTNDTAGISIAFAHFEGAVAGVQLLSAKNNFIAPTFSAVSKQGSVELSNIRALNSLTGSADVSAELDVSNTGIHGSLTSATSYVCTGVVAVTSRFSISGIETNSGGCIINVHASQGAAAVRPGYAASSIMIQCGAATSITSTTTGLSTTLTTSSSTTTASSTSPSTTVTTSTSTSAMASSSFATTAETSSSTSTTFTSGGTTSSTTTTSALASSSTTATTTSTTSSSSSSSLFPTQKRERTETRTPINNSTRPPPRPPALALMPRAASAAVTGLSLFAMPSSATSMRALSAASSLFSCASSQQDGAMEEPSELGWDANLLHWTPVSGPLATYSGSVLSSITLTLGLIVLSFAAAVFRSHSQSITIRESMRKVHCPSIAYMVVAVVCPSGMFSSVVLVLHPLSKALLWLGVVGIIFSVLPLVVFFFLARHFDEHETLMPEVRDLSTYSLHPPGLMKTFLKLVDLLTAPVREWRSSVPSGMWCYMVENHRSVWLAMADFAFAIIMSVVAGVAVVCRSSTCCAVCSYSMAGVAGMYLVLLGLTRGLLVRFDKINVPLMGTLTFTMALLAVITAHVPSVESAVVTIGEVIYYLAIVSLVIATFANALPTMIWLCSKCNKSLAAVQAARERQSEKRQSQHSRRGNDDEHAAAPLLGDDEKKEEEEETEEVPQRRQQQREPQNVQEMMVMMAGAPPRARASSSAATAAAAGARMLSPRASTPRTLVAAPRPKQVRQPPPQHRPPAPPLSSRPASMQARPTIIAPAQQQQRQPRQQQSQQRAPSTSAREMMLAGRPHPQQPADDDSCVHRWGTLFDGVPDELVLSPAAFTDEEELLLNDARRGIELNSDEDEDEEEMTMLSEHDVKKLLGRLAEQEERDGTQL